MEGNGCGSSEGHQAARGEHALRVEGALHLVVQAAQLRGAADEHALALDVHLRGQGGRRLAAGWAQLQALEGGAAATRAGRTPSIVLINVGCRTETRVLCDVAFTYRAA